MSQATIDLKGIDNKKIKFSMEIIVSIKELISEGKYYKVLINKSNKAVGLRILTKVLILKESFHELSTRATLIYNTHFSRKKDKVYINYRTEIEQFNVTKNGSLYTIKVIDINLGLEYTVPAKTYREKVIDKHSNETKKTISETVREAQRSVEAREKTPIQQYPKRAIEARVWTAKDTAFKRCGNCINLMGSNVCRKHQRKMSVDNACNLFYAPRVYLGGGVSPR
ncbi:MULTISPECIES: hypothetical protein [unclassified Bacillus (in: firmicutes)]|uniref:hypothetical protein n=1 Tax=unclassified Bacillus (in: firmicutes) TaxID=185979 RepID=UPI0008E208CB|nr:MULTISPECIES: hypothetical protein [unclassified Bacillus (in: firmicutes)]SFB20227.1 hypothetical protein SAMN02799634_10876 [Bacillus sp. UNCCL13]SFQ90838.1 hypothetical protein SAMN04488577_3891 [Bacillus sp. cl95]